MRCHNPPFVFRRHASRSFESMSLCFRVQRRQLVAMTTRLFFALATPRYIKSSPLCCLALQSPFSPSPLTYPLKVFCPFPRHGYDIERQCSTFLPSTYVSGYVPWGHRCFVVDGELDARPVPLRNIAVHLPRIRDHSKSLGYRSSSYHATQPSKHKQVPFDPHRPATVSGPESSFFMGRGFCVAVISPFQRVV